MDLENDSRSSRLVPKCKAVIIGDQSVGKSSIIQRYTKKAFEQRYNSTVGIDFVSKVVNLQNGKQIRLQIWDTAGQQRFRSLIPGYLKDCGAAIIVFDLTSHHSYQAVSSWMDIIRDTRGNDALIVIVANKSDRRQQRQVSQQQMEDLQRKHATKINRVSALTGQGIQQLFHYLCEQLQRKYAHTITSFGDTMQLIQDIKINKPKVQKKQCCSS